MDFKLLLYIQGFIVAAIFTVATIIWYRINNKRPVLYNCRHAIKFILMITLILIIKAFRLFPDPQNIRLIIQHLLTAAIAIGFFFEIKKVYKKNFLKRKKELAQFIESSSDNPLKKELDREIIRPELKRLGGLRKLIKDENEILENKKGKLDAREYKIGGMKNNLSIEKKRVMKLKRELALKEKELKNVADSIKNRKRNVERKEKTYGKRELKLKGRLEDIKKINRNIREGKKDIDKKVRITNMLKEDIKDQKKDILIELKKLKKLKK